MNDFILSCCSTVDLTNDYLKDRNLQYLYFSYSINGKTYKDDLGQTMPYDEFYKAMDSGAVTKTSQINAEEYVNYFLSFLEKGQDILHICFSSGLSGSYNSAVAAKNELQEKFSDRKIYIVDSLCASSGYGLMMDTLYDLKQSGMDIDSLYDWALNNRLKIHHLFFSTDLTFYIKGGRVSKTAGIVGTLLNICPILLMNKQGKLVPKAKAIGKKKAMKKLLLRMEELADDGLCYNKRCFISHSNCPNDANMLKTMVADTFPKMNGNIQVFSIGTTIGSHTGCGTVALFFFGKDRED